MKVAFFLIAAVVLLVECKHTFLGTNVNRPMVHHQLVQKPSKVFMKTIDNLYYMVPSVPMQQRVIQGILAVDMKGTEASANVTQGGIGYNFVNIRMKSERGKSLNYDIYIYA